MSNKDDEFIPLEPGEIIPGDPVTTIWKWCSKNGWAFVFDFLGGEPWVDQRCAWAMIKPDSSFKTAQNQVLAGIERVNGLVRLSKVMVRRGPEH